jgi:hypothetical protein
MKRFTILAYDYGREDHEVVVAECDTSPKELLKAVKRMTLYQQVGKRTFNIRRYSNPRIRENQEDTRRGQTLYPDNSQSE